MRSNERYRGTGGEGAESLRSEREGVSVVAIFVCVYAFSDGNLDICNHVCLELSSSISMTSLLEMKAILGLLSWTPC